MKVLRVERPSELAAALSLMAARHSEDVGTNAPPSEIAKLSEYEKAWLAGGQSLLAAMKLGMNDPDVLIDLQDLVELRGIRFLNLSSELQVGAMETHANISNSEKAREFCPGLVELAGGIADQQVRNMGTIGGSLANNDPAACWPAGVLALKATLVTTRRELKADDFFKGIFSTALDKNELIQHIRFVKPDAFKYLKFEQPASRFALLGVAVARFADEVRVAITGLGQGVQRWALAEKALEHSFTLKSLEGLVFPVDQGISDLHASAEYRAHLAAVLCRRVVASMLSDVENIEKCNTKAGNPKRNPKSQVSSVQGNPVPRPFVNRVWAQLLRLIRR